MVRKQSVPNQVHEDIPLEWQVAGLEVMRMADWHVFQVRQRARMANSKFSLMGISCRYAKPPSITWGVSVENRRHGLPRIDAACGSAGQIKWLSIEPLLEDLGAINLNGIHWVVVGGESGPNARPMKEEWVISIRDQCQAARIPFFLKQWGNWDTPSSVLMADASILGLMGPGPLLHVKERGRGTAPRSRLRRVFAFAGDLLDECAN